MKSSGFSSENIDNNTKKSISLYENDIITYENEINYIGCEITPLETTCIEEIEIDVEILIHNNNMRRQSFPFHQYNNTISNIITKNDLLTYNNRFDNTNS